MPPIASSRRFSWARILRATVLVLVGLGVVLFVAARWLLTSSLAAEKVRAHLETVLGIPVQHERSASLLIEDEPAFLQVQCRHRASVFPQARQSRAQIARWIEVQLQRGTVKRHVPGHPSAEEKSQRRDIDLDALDAQPG